MRVAIRAALLGLLGIACTESNIYINSMEPNIPNKITISGRVCTDDPAERQFPVKLMFIVDTSGEMAENDTYGNRMTAVQDIITRYQTASNYHFAIVKYGGEVMQLTEGYTKNIAILNEAVAELVAPNGCSGGTCRDWEGALSMASSIFSGDVLTSNPGVLSRTRYVFVFVAAGPQDPAGTAFDPLQAVQDIRNFGEQEGVAEVTFHTVQVLDRPSTCDIPGETRYCSDAVPCPANCVGTEVCSSPANLCAADHTLTCEECVDRCEFIRLCGDGSMLECVTDEECCPRYACVDGSGTAAMNNDTAATLQAMAYEGRGEFFAFTTGAKLNFWVINLDTTQAVFVKKAFVVTNSNVRSACGQIMADSDGDGLSDREEECYAEVLSGECRELDRCDCVLDLWNKDTGLGTDTNPAKADTDGDGIGDKLEMMFATINLDPLRVDLPQACYGLERPFLDKDADGLNDCEEQILGTNPSLFDSDRDGYPDSLEFRLGTNYLMPDQLNDTDLDGAKNGLELEQHLDPQCNDTLARAGDAYRYKIIDEGLRVVPFASQPKRATGVEIVDLSGRAEEGASTLFYYPTGSRRADGSAREGPALAWADRADGIPGEEVAITGSGTYQLFSACFCVLDCPGPCAPGEWCDPNLGSCQPDACTHLSCTSSEKCDPSQARCVPDCTKAECSMGETCDPLLGKCLTDRCLNADCPEDQYCDPESGICTVTPCMSWACEPGKRLAEDQKPPWIVVRVDENLLPLSGFWCDGSPGLESCQIDADCPLESYCRIRENIVVGLASKNCLSFKVKNITLVETLETQDGYGAGYNNIFLYFGQTPLDNPGAFSIFRAALVQIRFVNGVKEPNWAEVPLDNGDFYAIEEK